MPASRWALFFETAFAPAAGADCGAFSATFCGIDCAVAAWASKSMLIGNGYVPGHAEAALALLRTRPPLLAAFERLVHS